MSIECNELRDAFERFIRKYGKQEKFDFDYIGEKIRRRGYLTPLELFYIICWKAPSRDVNRGKAANNAFKCIKRSGTECIQRIETITREAIELARNNEIKESIEKLVELFGVRTRVASAILTFYDPENFGVVDVRAWKSLYKELKQDFEPEDYVKYLKDIRELAKKCNLTSRNVDQALWEGL